MRIHVLAFARVRELLGLGERNLDLPDGATARDAWEALSAAGTLAPLAASTRLACNGVLVDGATVLHDGDEVAFLPPVGGG